MLDKFICAFAEYDKSTQDEITSLYNILVDVGIIGTQTKGLPYHITLGNFEVDYEEELLALFQKISISYNYFKLDLSHLGLFDMNVLFIAPDVNYDLLNLKDNICNGRTDEDREWTAHTTLIIDDEDIISNSFSLVSREFKVIKAKITHISLYEFHPTRLIGRFKLK